MSARAQGTPRYDVGGVLPAGITSLRNDTGAPIFFEAREESANAGRLAREELARRAEEIGGEK